jgi:peroxiredoxin
VPLDEGIVPKMEKISPSALSDEVAASLVKSANDRAELLKKGIEPPFQAMLTKHRRVLENSANWEKFPRVGSSFPQFALPDSQGNDQTLWGLLEGGPVVMVFYRGGWCPFCSLALRAYQRYVIPELTELGGRLVAVSAEVSDNSLTTREVNQLTFTVLSDVGNQLARQLNLTYPVSKEYIEHLDETNRDLRKINGVDDDSLELAHPATYVIDSTGMIRFADVHPDYRFRTEPSDILDALRAIATS